MGNCASVEPAAGEAVYLPHPGGGGVGKKARPKPRCAACDQGGTVFLHTNGASYCSWCLVKAKEDRQVWEQERAVIAAVKARMYPRRPSGRPGLPRIDSGSSWTESESDSFKSWSAGGSPASSLKGGSSGEGEE